MLPLHDGTSMLICASWSGEDSHETPLRLQQNPAPHPSLMLVYVYFTSLYLFSLSHFLALSLPPAQTKTVYTAQISG